MLTKFVVKPQSYQDSLKLMDISSKLGGVPGIELAAAVMGTENNRVALAEGGFVLDSSVTAGPDDIIVALRGEREEALQGALKLLDSLLAPVSSGQGGVREEIPRSLSRALDMAPEANIALISVPGDYAAAEAFKALNAGLNVMIFSDNVEIYDEVELKRMGRERGLFVMGPDCGTAIIGGVPLCFANAVKSGSIGVVGASGTGIQQVTVLLDRLGAGVSHAIGTGGRDLSDEVGGIMTLMGLDALEGDEATRVIMLVSKPAGPATTAKLAERLKSCNKPVVVVFPGKEVDLPRLPGVYAAPHLESASAMAVSLLTGSEPDAGSLAFPREGIDGVVDEEVAKIGSGRKWIRGLYSGGSLAGESAYLLEKAVGAVYSNFAKNAANRLSSAAKSEAHCVIDLGDDQYTRGRPHPMIDPSYRIARLQQEYAEGDVAVVLLDVVLGYGAHPDPAGVLAKAVREIRSHNADYVSVVASVCGTGNDPQHAGRQAQALRDAGVLVFPSNAYAAEVASRIAAKCAERRTI